MRGAVLVDAEHCLHAAEAGGLQVEHGWSPRQRLDVGDRVDRFVPGDPVAMALEQADCAVFEGGILDPRVR